MTRTTSGITSPALRMHDRVADANVLALQFVDVVQRGVADGHAADEHGLEPRDGRQRAGAPHLPLDRAHRRHLLLGGKLVGDRPARRARNEAKLALLVDRIDLVDDAVDLVAKRAPLRPISS